jgi:hypothetical protein
VTHDTYLVNNEEKSLSMRFEGIKIGRRESVAVGFVGAAIVELLCSEGA